MKTITYDDTLYQLVPKEATERIKRAIFVMLASADDEGRFYRKVIEMASSEANSMLSAAPTPPAQPAERKPQEWMPIETAPKDGIMFLCWISAVRYGETDEGQPYQQDASQIDFCWWRDGVDGNGYFDPACGQIGDSQDVTHWIPLPAPPETGIKGES